MTLYKRQIVKIFTDYKKLTTYDGIWMDGTEGDGELIFFHKNGRLEYKWNYANNELNGFAMKYDEAGNIIYKEEYKNNNLIKRWL